MTHQVQSAKILLTLDTTMYYGVWIVLCTVYYETIMLFSGCTWRILMMLFSLFRNHIRLKSVDVQPTHDHIETKPSEQVGPKQLTHTHFHTHTRSVQ